ncbi:uncharacterized protein DDB_G0271670-like [Hibiscus syriacus]|uniref:uncharacterized protein DDB_G0271670-like n=1 Tax=Hibiscus syriacus TaxID=106335 RepID=UPI001922C69F|nr:uncharacterized protein DDB_G0271670-like [Hibiscus syriacus]
MVPLENSFEEASVSHPPLPEGNLRCVEQKCIASGKVKQTTNRTTQHGTVLKDKGNTVSAIKNKAKVQHITKDVGIKSKPNPSLCREASVKVNKSVILGKENTPNAVRSISRQITGSRSSLPRLYGPSKRGGLNQTRNRVAVQIPSAQVTRLVSSSSSSSIRKTQAKASLKGTRQEKELPVKISRTRVTRLVSSSSSSSSSTSNTEVKPSSKRTNHRTELPVQIPSAQVTRSVSSSSSSRTSKTEAKPSSKRTNQEKELPEQISSAQVRRLALSSASSSIKKTEVKPSLKRTKQETELPEKICNAQVTRLVSSSSSSSIKKTEVKPSSKGTNKETEFPVQIPNAQVTSLVSSSSSSSSSIINTEDKSYLKRTNQETKLPVQIPSDQETRLVSSSSSCIRKTEATTCSDRTNLRILCTQVTRVVSSSSKSIITNTEAKSGTKRTDQETELPVQIPSAQVTMPVSSDGIGVEQIQTCNKKQKVEQIESLEYAKLKFDQTTKNFRLTTYYTGKRSHASGESGNGFGSVSVSCSRRN